MAPGRRYIKALNCSVVQHNRNPLLLKLIYVIKAFEIITSGCFGIEEQRARTNDSLSITAPELFLNKTRHHDDRPQAIFATREVES